MHPTGSEIERRLAQAEQRAEYFKAAFEAALTLQAWQDSLTGLLSRAGIVEVIDGHVAPVAPQMPIAALAIGIDDFTMVNDSLGRDGGNRVLQAVAGRLTLTLRETDFVARASGDEFAIVLTGAVGDASARRVGARLAALLAEPIFVDDVPVYVTASVGVVVSEAGRGAATVLGHAELAMRHAKRAGRDRVVAYAPEMHDVARSRLILEAQLRRTIERGALTVLYQPIMSMDDRSLVGFEGLVRWDHPERGRLGPAEFLDLAEHVGLMDALDEQVLAQVCDQLARWTAIFGRDDIIGAVNLSPRSLARSDLVDVVRTHLARTGVAPHRLHLEITENRLMEDIDVTVGVLSRLKELGVRLAIDDFGTGHSSLAHVARFGAHVLKIDRAFVAPLGHDPNGDAVIQTITALAARLNLDTVIEGVETPAQLAHVAELGVGAVQGYVFSRPVDAGEATRMVAADASRAPLPAA